MYCTECGNKVKKGNKFCSNCGKKIEEEYEFKRENTITKRNESNNTGAIITGIFSLITILIPCLSIPLAIASIILGISNKSKKISPATIMGLISLTISTVMIVLIILMIRNASYYEEEKNPWNIIDEKYVNHNGYI